MTEDSLEILQENQTHTFQKVDPTDEIVELENRLSSDPKNVDLLMEKAALETGIWDYQGSIDTYSHAIAIEPTKAILFRWRGHRMINVRMIPEGVADLALSVHLDPSNWETWYHLALGQYLLRNHQDAAISYQKCMEHAPTEGDQVAVADWSWRNFMRLGDKTKAEEVIDFVYEDMDYGENYAYHRCIMMYKEIISPNMVLDNENESDINKVTIGYGLGNYYYVHEEHRKAKEIWKNVRKETFWPAFGHIASEFGLLEK